MDTEQAFHELRLTLDASEEAIRKAHKELSHEWHPDHDGDVEVMQRLNQARDVALRHASELSGEHTQGLVLREILDLEKRREDREDSREKGRELVAVAATVQVGDLRRTQRRASNVAIFTAAAAAVLGLLKLTVLNPGPLADIYLIMFGAIAVGGALFRTILAERISQIQFALDDVGTTLTARSTYAVLFRDITGGLVDESEFEEEDLRLAIRLWLSPAGGRNAIEWLKGDLAYADGTTDDALREDAETADQFLPLRDIIRRSRIDEADHVEVGGVLASLVETGELRCFLSPKGLCFRVADVVELARGEAGILDGQFGDGTVWDELWASLAHRPHTPLRSSAQLTPLGALRKAVRRFRHRVGEAAAPKIEGLAEQIGVVDLTKLLIGKGLENRLLAGHEIQDRNGNLITLYAFKLDPSTG